MPENETRDKQITKQINTLQITLSNKNSNSHKSSLNKFDIRKSVPNNSAKVPALIYSK